MEKQKQTKKVVEGVIEPMLREVSLERGAYPNVQRTDLNARTRKALVLMGHERSAANRL